MPCLNPFKLLLFLILLCLAVDQAVVAQGLSVISPTRTSGDTTFLCLDNSSTITYNANYTPSPDSIVWTFQGGSPNRATGSGSHPVTYSGTGVFSSTVRVYNGGNVDTSYVIRTSVQQIGAMTFTTPDTLCESDPAITLSATPPGGSFSGPGVSGNKFDPDAANPGLKIITYTVQKGPCTKSTTDTIYVKDAPEPMLRSTGSSRLWQNVLTYYNCDTSSTTSSFDFYNQSFSTSYSSYQIDFGDGSTTTGTVFPNNPGSPLSHSYSNPGLYTVTLTLFNSNGCSRTSVVNVFFGRQPAIGFNIPGGAINQCIPQDSGYIEICVAITNVSANSPYTIYTLSSNDGSSDTVFSHPPPDTVCHKFYIGSCGINSSKFNDAFELSLRASVPCIDRSATVEPIYISKPSTAAFLAPQRTCVGQQVSIADNSQVGGVARPSGCLGSSAGKTIWEITPATFSTPNGTADLGTTYGLANPSSWYPGADPLNVTFNKTGVYQVMQIVGNALECSPDTLITDVCVDSIPVAGLSLSSDTICSGDSLTASFIGEYLGICDTMDIRWTSPPQDSGRLGLSAAFDTTQNFVFTEVGVYPIRMVVENTCDSIEVWDTVVVKGVPSVVLPADTAICGFAAVDFSASHIAPIVYDSLTEVSYSWSVLPASGWSFTGGTSASSMHPVIGFTQHGTFNVLLTVSGSCGTHTDTMEVAINEPPQLSALLLPFRDTVICAGNSMIYKASATLGQGPYQFQWGGFSTGILYTGDSIQLSNLLSDTTLFVKVTDALGCSDSMGFRIAVMPIPTVDAGSDVSICYADSVKLNGSLAGGISPLTYSWSPSAGLSSTSVLDPWRIPLDTTVTYTLTVTDSLGCTYQDSVTISVYPKPNFSAGSSFTVCLNQGDTTLSGAAPSGGTWSGTGISGSVFSPGGAGLGTHVLTYSYTDPNGCFYSDTITADVIPQPNPDFGMDVSLGCSPLTVNFADSSGAPSGHQWFMNGIPFSTQANPTHTFTNPSNTADIIVRIKLLFQAGSGCSDSIVKTITVFPVPMADFSLPSIICAGDSQLITNLSQYKGTPTYTWSASSATVQISDTIAQQPVFHFPDFNNGTDSTYTICLRVMSGDGCMDTICKTVTIRSRPQADFSLPAQACTPVSISPTDLSSGSQLSYQWSVSPLTNVTSSGMSTATPSLSFTSPQQDSATYKITLLITDGNGCVDSVSKDYTVYAQPMAGFTVSNRDSCGPFNVHFTDTSSAGLSGGNQSLSYSWDFGNGVTFAKADTSITYTNSGVTDVTYTISLTVTNALGCSDIFYDSITVHPDPRAEVTLTDSVDCSPFTIDTTVIKAVEYPGANGSYEWRVLNNNRTLIQSFSGLSFSHLISAGGDTVYVQLITNNAFGCKADTLEQIFYTIVNPQPDFVAVPDTICSGGTVVLNNNSSAGVSSEWFVDGVPHSTATNTQVVLTNPSNTIDRIVIIKLRITAGSSGCKDSISKTVVVNPAPLAQFSLPATLCANDSAQVTNTTVPSTGVAFRWTVLGGGAMVSDSTATQPYFRFPDNQSGTNQNYQIRLIVTNGEGCTDTAFQTITINSRPVAGFSIPVNGCGPLTVSPSDTSVGQGLSYSWSVNPTTGVILSGSGSSSPQLGFLSPALDSAVYTVSLLVTDANGCIDTTSQTISVYPKPSAAFTASRKDSCGPLTVTFANSSHSNLPGQSRATMTFDWDFGNGQTSQDSVPTMTFTNTGVQDVVYPVRLVTWNSLNCTDTIFDSITVHPDPLAELDTSVSYGCAPFVIDSSVVKAMRYPGANLSYQWTLIDPATQAVIQNFSGAGGVNYTMLSAGDTILIRLVATSRFGCKNDTVDQLFRTIPNPEPGFVVSTRSGCHPLTVNITDTSSSGSLSYQWFINGQMQPTTLASPTFTLTNTSTITDSLYHIKLVVTAGATGCKDSVPDSVLVFALPNPSFSATEVCGGDTTQFTNTTQTLDTILSWHWDFGDGDSSVLENPTHAYTTFGAYPVSLTANDSRGCSQTIWDTIVVRPNPVADFASAQSCGPDTACLNKAFSFTDLSTVATLGGNITAWEWDVLNDGSVEYTAQNPQHTFTTAGIFDVKLKVQTQYGCVDSIVRQVRVLEPITAAFVTDTTATCGPLNIVATDSSTGPITTYRWELYSLDKNNIATSIYISNQQNPNPIPTLLPSYIDDTTYVLELTVSNCCDTVSAQQTFVLKPLPAAGMVALPPFGCSGFQVEFTIDGHTTGRPDSVMLSFGDGTPVRVIPVDTVMYQGNPVPVFRKQRHTFINNGTRDTTYIVTLKAKNECGDSTIQIPILVHPNIVQASFTYLPSQGCEDLTVEFRDSSFWGSNVVWIFDADSIGSSQQFTDTGRVVSHTYTEPGIYSVLQIVDDGCSYDTAKATIAVWDAPETDFTFTNFVCEDDPVTFSNQTLFNTGTVGVYRWYFGDGDSSTQKDPVHVYDTSGVFDVVLVALSPNGCRDSMSYQLTIHDRPDVAFSVENACAGDSLVFHDSTVVKNAILTKTTWQIDTLGTYFSNPSPFFITQPGSYTIKLIQESSTGCTDSLVKTLNVFEVPRAHFTVKQDTSVDSCGNIAAYIFRDSSISSTPLQYQWDFDLNNPGTMTSNVKNPGTQIFPDTGYYYISLTVWNGDSCWDTQYDSLYVKPKSRVNFSPLSPAACMNELIQFYDSTRYRTGSGNNVLTYLWNFGDGYTSTDKNPVHSYDSAGVYTIKLKVWDPSCVDSIERQVVIYNTPEPVIKPGTYQVCSRQIITLESLTLMQFPNGDQVDSLIWMLSDGRIIRMGRDSAVDLTFSQAGTYGVQLVAITDKGCRDTSSATVDIQVHPTPIVTLDEEQIDARTFDFLSMVDDAPDGTYYWDFGNGDNRVELEGSDTLNYRYTDRLCRIDDLIRYPVYLMVVNQIEDFGQCMDADTIEIAMEGYHLNVPNAFAPERENVGDANVFKPKGKLLGKYRLRIYDEWGNLIFETEELDENGIPTESWDGYYNGQLMPTGAYVWIIDAEFNDGYLWPVEECKSESIKAHGTVTLIR